MELKNIKTQTTWEAASEAINSNTSKINEAVTRLEHVTYKGKGYFKTQALLESEYPTALPGSWAYVGTAYPFRIFHWDRDTSSWQYSGADGGDENLDLSMYYTREEAQEVFVRSDSVRVIESGKTEQEIQDMIDSGTIDMNVMYLTFED